VIAVHARLRDDKESVRKIISRINQVCGLLLAGIITQESQKMPITLDLKEHAIFGPELQEAKREGRQEGELAILRRVAEKRLGAIPAGADPRLTTCSLAELEDLAMRLLTPTVLKIGSVEPQGAH